MPDYDRIFSLQTTNFAMRTSRPHAKADRTRGRSSASALSAALSLLFSVVAMDLLNLL